MITLHVGWQSKQFPLAGYSVGSVADEFSKDFNIQADAKVFVNGEEADRDAILKDGDNLEFLNPNAGVKGCGQPDCPSCQKKK